MAKVFQIVATGEFADAFDHHYAHLIDGTYHAAVNYAGPRTVCGIQLDGEDGIGEGPTTEGKVTCIVCINVIAEIQQIKNWR